MKKLIKRNMPIDYYVVYYPKMVTAYFQCVSGYSPIKPLADSLADHIQAVVDENNNEVLRHQTYRHMVNIGAASGSDSSWLEFCDQWDHRYGR